MTVDSAGEITQSPTGFHVVPGTDPAQVPEPRSDSIAQERLVPSGRPPGDGTTGPVAAPQKTGQNGQAQSAQTHDPSAQESQVEPETELRHWARRLFIGDVTAICVTVVAFLAIWEPMSGEPLSAGPTRALLAVSFVTLWPTILYWRRAYSPTVFGQGPEEYRRVLIACGTVAAAVASIAYFNDTNRGRGYYAAVLVTGTAMLLATRHVQRLRLRSWVSRGHPLQRVYVVAAPSDSDDLFERINRTDGLFAAVGGWNIHCEGSDPRRVIEAAVAAKADILLCSPCAHTDASWVRRLGWAMEDTDMHLMVDPSLVEVAGPRLSIEPVPGLHLLRVDLPKFSGPARTVKRTLDFIGATLLLALAGIPMLLIGLLVRIESRGPAIYRQVRSGQGGTTFMCWKFRTMVADADKQRDALRAEFGDGGATFKMAKDPRVTRVGRVLRRLSIDELPQLVNVLKGDMSLVGPRPHPLDDVDRYDHDAHRRLLAKPGMTGLWQVSGRSNVGWDEAVMLDLYYVENWSLTMDTVILLRTLKAVLAGSGAH